MSNISAVIITKNEERNIGRCINSVQGVVDEIVVIDSFSSDLTPQICRAKGVKFIQTKWLGYAATKNFGHSQAKFDYILSIDADEALDEALQKAMLKVKPKLAGVYALNRLTNYCGKWIKHSGWYPERVTRLYNKKNVSWNEEDQVHETLKFVSPEKPILLQGHLLHFSFPKLSSHRRKIAHYSRLEAQEAKLLPWPQLSVKLLLSPTFKFVKMYFLKAGFLDGMAGFHLARLSAYSTYRRYNQAIQMKMDD